MTGAGITLSNKPETRSLLALVSSLLVERGIRSYLTGGFVRDVLLGRETADIDIALVADATGVAPGVAAALGGRYFTLDEVNRVGRVVVFDPEIAGGRWQLDFTSIDGSIEQDLARRDLTVNAMAVDLEELGRGVTGLKLIDPFHGLDDLSRSVIRTVSQAAFASDAARLLRAVRLAAELGFTIAPETDTQIRRDCHLAAGVAGERTREELLRLLAASRTGQFPRYLGECGLLTAIIPELKAAKGCQQPAEHFWDVFHHSLETVATTDFLIRQGSWEHVTDEALAVVPWSPSLDQYFAAVISRGSTRRTLLKLAGLLHDVAKPKTKTIEADGRMRFLGHAGQGAAMAVDILERLRFSTGEIRLVETMVKYHLRPGELSRRELPTRRAIYRYFRDTGKAGIDTLFMSLADHLAARGPQLELEDWQQHAQVVDYVLTRHQQEAELVAPPRLVDGRDIISLFGVSPGPRIGELLEAVREAQAAGELDTREGALAYIRDRLPSTAG